MKVLPSSIVVKMMPTSQFPDSDKELVEDSVFLDYFYTVGVVAMRQGSSAALTEVFTLFRNEYSKLEESLKAYYADESSSSSQQLPRVSIFQGSEDVNVPPSHSAYVHNQVLNKRSKLRVYDGLGHLSLVGVKAGDYARAVMPTVVTDS
jgi:esterase/lipase